MKVLENWTKDSKLELEVLEDLQEFKDLNQQQAHADLEAMLWQHCGSEEEWRRSGGGKTSRTMCVRPWPC